VAIWRQQQQKVERTIVANRKTFVARHWLLLEKIIIIQEKKKEKKSQGFLCCTRTGPLLFRPSAFVVLATMQFQFKLLLFCTFHLNNFSDLFLF